MHRLTHIDRTFSAGDVVRIFEDHLEEFEQGRVVEYFMLNYCVLESDVIDDLTDAGAEALLDFLIDILTPDIGEAAVRFFIELVRKRGKRSTLRGKRNRLRLLLGLEGQQRVITKRK